MSVVPPTATSRSSPTVRGGGLKNRAGAGSNPACGMEGKGDEQRRVIQARRVSLTGKALVSKTSVASLLWGFESLTLRCRKGKKDEQRPEAANGLFLLRSSIQEGWQSGRMRRVASAEFRATGIRGSNPLPSAASWSGQTFRLSYRRHKRTGARPVAEVL